jgi:phosphate:Na+ symporter
MDWFKICYTLLGGLGLFFFGITQLSESLQTIAGNTMKKVVNWLTTNRIIAVFVGLIITMIIQSSSVTTVMVLSFVNAGLMSLTQAIGVIFGSNIGTTVTGWIIAIKVGKYGLVFIGIGIFPMLFAKSSYLKGLGKLLFALGLVFYGLELMGFAFKPLRDNQEFLSLLHYFSADTLLSIIGCVLVSSILTAIIQSSSAMLGITIAMAMSGILTFQTAAALVLGQNIGTTITAFLASISSRTNAKRAARAHIIFNLVGVAIILFIFHPYIKFIDWLVYGSADFVGKNGNKPYIATHIAAAHTIFNITATIMFLPFLKHLANFVTFITPDKDIKEPAKLSLFSSHDISPALAIEGAHQEIQKMASMVKSAIELSMTYLLSEVTQIELMEKVKKYENITDNIQKEVYLFLNQVLKSNMSAHLTHEASSLIRASDELESIADYCLSITSYRNRINVTGAKLSSKRKTLIDKFFKDTVDFYDYTVKAITTPEEFNNKICVKTYVRLNNQANTIRDEHLKVAQVDDEDPLSSLTFSDIIVALRRIKNHSLNLSQAMGGGKRSV